MAPTIRSAGDRPRPATPSEPGRLHLDRRHHRPRPPRSTSSPPALTQQPPRPTSPSRAPTPAARASPPSSAASTRPARRLGGLHLAARTTRPRRRHPQIRSAGRSTTPATPSLARPPSAGPSTPPRRSTPIDTHRRRSTNAAAADFTFSGTDAGGSGVASFECRLDSAARRLGTLHLAGELAASPTAPTTSKSARSTTPATPMPRRPPSPGPSTPPRRRPRSTPIRRRSRPRTRPASPSRAPTPAARASPPSNAAATPKTGRPAPRRELRRARRGLPQLRSQGDRQRRQRRPEPGLLQLERRHHRPADPDRHPSGGARQRRRPPASPSRARPRRLGRRLLPMPPRLQPPGDWGSCTSPRELSGLAEGTHTSRSGRSTTPATPMPSPAALQLDGRHHRPRHPDRHPARRPSPTPPPPTSPSRAPTPAARASPPSNAASTRRSPATGRPAPRRANSAASPTAPTLSKSARSTTPATPMRSPASYSWTVDTTAPETPIDTHPTAAHQRRRRRLHLLGHRRRRLGRRLLRVPPRLQPARRLGSLHLAARTQRPRRRLPQIRSPRDRQGRQRRPEPGHLHLDGRHRRAAGPAADRDDPRLAGQRQRPEACRVGDLRRDRAHLRQRQCSGSPIATVSAAELEAGVRSRSPTAPHQLQRHRDHRRRKHLGLLRTAHLRRGHDRPRHPDRHRARRP